NTGRKAFSIDLELGNAGGFGCVKARIISTEAITQGNGRSGTETIGECCTDVLPRIVGVFTLHIVSAVRNAIDVSNGYLQVSAVKVKRVVGCTLQGPGVYHGLNKSDWTDLFHERKARCWRHIRVIEAWLVGITSGDSSARIE